MAELAYGFLWEVLGRGGVLGLGREEGSRWRGTGGNQIVGPKEECIRLDVLGRLVKLEQ